MVGTVARSYHELIQKINQYDIKDIMQIYPGIIGNPLSLKNHEVLTIAMGGVRYKVNTGQTYSVASSKCITKERNRCKAQLYK